MLGEEETNPCATEVQNKAPITPGALAKLPQHGLKALGPSRGQGEPHTGTAPAPPEHAAGWDSPEGNRVEQEMKDGNAAHHAQGNDSNNVAVAWQQAARTHSPGPC